MYVVIQVLGILVSLAEISLATISQIFHSAHGRAKDSAGIPALSSRLAQEWLFLSFSLAKRRKRWAKFYPARQQPLPHSFIHPNSFPCHHVLPPPCPDRPGTRHPSAKPMTKVKVQRRGSAPSRLARASPLHVVIHALLEAACFAHVRLTSQA